MIQRLQTVYLLFASVLSGLLLKGNIFNFIDRAGSRYFINSTGIYKSGEVSKEIIEKLMPYTIVLILIPVIFFITLFLYKNRKLQFKLTLIGIIMTGCLVIMTICYSVHFMHKLDLDIVLGIKMYFPILIIIFALLAFRNITKDEKLVRSYDRLR